MKISKNALEIIKKFEGLRLKAYKCPSNIYTIGYGHTGLVFGKKITHNTEISKQIAHNLLLNDISIYEKVVENYNNKYHFNQNEFDALVSFAFNVGNINQLTAQGTRSKSEIANYMLLYNKSNGNTLPGLVKRRKKEHDLFLKPRKNSNNYSIVTPQKNYYIRKSPTGKVLTNTNLVRQINIVSRGQSYTKIVFNMPSTSILTEGFIHNSAL